MNINPSYQSIRKSVVCVFTLSMGIAIFSGNTVAQWNQWGGPERDFKVKSSNLANDWPEGGPQKIWSRSLGEGYSSIAVDDGKLYTMYRDGDDEIIIALRADNGETIWKHRYSSSVVDENAEPDQTDEAKSDKKDDKDSKKEPKVKNKFETRFGTGPNSTPLIHHGKVFALGVNGNLFCLDQKSGKPVWSHDLVKDHGAKYPEFGFSSSPIVYKNSLIYSVGGKGCGMMAFDLNSGSVIWKKNDFENTYSSPIIIRVGGQDQAILLTDREVVGVNPSTGDLLWRHEHVNQWKTNISTPIWDSKEHLYVTSGGEAGSRVLKLTLEGGKTTVEEIWSNRKMGIGQGNVIKVDGYIYGFAGGHQGAFMTAINAKTGEIAWRERGYKSSMMIHADNKLIILDEDGTLSLAEATPEAFKVLSKVELLKNVAWTIPTLVGKTLYVRDKETIVALNLGKS